MSSHTGPIESFTPTGAKKLTRSSLAKAPELYISTGDVWGGFIAPKRTLLNYTNSHFVAPPEIFTPIFLACLYSNIWKKSLELSAVFLSSWRQKPAEKLFELPLNYWHVFLNLQENIFTYFFLHSSIGDPYSSFC